ncbi:MAG: helix-turn-helix transcriptional regulator [Pirellulaceae bacterium]|nr:helix-turn-helix transcriptional regulator [Pirellulaceae bacterium]
MLQAISDASKPGTRMSLSMRRSLLVSRLGELVGADVWLWFQGVYNAKELGDSMVTSFVDGGFKSEVERSEFFRVIINPDLVALVNAPISDALATHRSILCQRSQLVTSERWKSLTVSAIWNALGFDHFIIAAFPIGPVNYSAVGLHRRLGKPDFSDRDMTIVRLLIGSVDWLHADSLPVEASEYALSLSPRERHVIVHLIQGDSRKEVAAKLGLSEHTVGDYLKEIYRKFGVNSRAELLSKFINAST